MLAVLILVSAKVLDTNMRAGENSYLQTKEDPIAAPEGTAATNANDGGSAVVKTNLRNVAHDLREEFESATAEMDKEMKQAMEQHSSEFKEAISQTQSSITKVQDNNDKALKALVENQQKVVKELNDRIQLAQDDEAAHTKSQLQNQQDVVTLAQTTSNELRAGGKKVQATISALEQTAQSFQPKIIEAKEEAQTEATAAATNVQEQVKKETEEVRSDMHDQISTTKTQMERDVKDLGNQIATAKSDQTSALASAESSMSSRMDQLASEISGAQTMLSATQAKVDNSVSALAALGATQSGALDKAQEGLKGKMDEVTANVKLQKDTVTQQLQNELKQMTMDIESMEAGKQQAVKTEVDGQIKEIKDQIKSDTAEVTESIANVQTQQDGLSGQIDAIKQKAAETKALVDSANEHIAKQQTDLTSKMDAMKTANDESLSTINTEIKGQMDAQKKALDEKALSMSTTAAANLQSTKEAIETKIGNLQAEVAGASSSSMAQMKATTSKAEALLTNIKTVAKDIADQKEAVAKQVPKTTAAMQKSYSDVATKIDTVGKQLSASRDQVLKVLESSTQAIDAQTQQSMQGVEDHVRSQLKQSSDSVEKTMGSLMEQISTLKAGSESDYTMSRQAQADLHDELQKSVARAMAISKRSEDEGSTLKTKIAEAINLMKSADNNEAHDSQQLEAQLQDLMHTQVQAASSDAGRKIKAAMDKQNGALSSFEQKAAKEMASDESLIQQYAQASNGKLAQVSDAVKELGFSVQKTELAAESKNSDLLAQTRSLAQQQRALSDKSDRAAQVEKAMIQKRTEELKKLVQDKVQAVASADQAQISALKRQTTSAFDEEKARQELEKNKVSSTVKSWQDKLGGEISQVGDAVKSTESGLRAFQDSETGAESAFQQEVSKLDKDISTSEDRVDATIKQEDAHVSGIMRGELGNMQSLVETFTGTQADAEKKIADMKASFDEQLKFVQGQGSAKSAELSSKLEHVEEHAADLVSEFRQDTQASQQELAATQQRLDKVVGSTTDSMGRFHAQLDQVQKARLSETTKLHSDIDNVKTSLTQTMQHTGEKIQQMKKDSDQAYKSMADKQQQFDATLLQASNDAAAKEEAELQAVSTRMDTLEQDHERLGEWQRSFKHRTLAWRQEVERRLGQLTGQVADANSMLQTTQLQAALPASALPELEAGLAGPVAAAGSAASSAAGSLAAIQAESQASVGASQQALAGATGALQRAVQADGAALEPATSFAEIQEGAGSDSTAALQQQNQALRALNAELMQENKHLYEEDTKLDGRVAALAAQLDAKK